MAITHRAIRIERDENTIALLLDILHAVEVLALLTDNPDDQRRLLTILEETQRLKQITIDRRNKTPAA